MQSRHVVPAYFGVGHALQYFIQHNVPTPAEGVILSEAQNLSISSFVESTVTQSAREAVNLAQLQSMCRNFPLFLDIIRNVEMGIAKADFSVARLYADLVEDKALRDRVYSTLLSEFDLTQRMVSRRPRPVRRCSR